MAEATDPSASPDDTGPSRRSNHFESPVTTDGVGTVRNGTAAPVGAVDGRTHRSDERAASPVVGKAMEAAIVVLYVGLVTAVLYGGVVPQYQAAAGAEVAERTLADAATDVEGAIPPEVTAAEASHEVDLPATIDGHAYRVTVDDGSLVLEHPSPAIDARIALVLPDRVVSVEGSWESGERAVVRVRTTEEGLEVRLE